MFITQRVTVDGEVEHESTSPIDVETIGEIRKTFRLGESRVKVEFEFDPPLVVPSPYASFISD